MFNFSGTGASFKIGGQPNGYNGFQSQSKRGRKSSTVKKEEYDVQTHAMVNPFNLGYQKRPPTPKEEEDHTIKPHLVFGHEERNQ